MDYAIQSLKMRAKSGDTNAFVELGKKYLSGDGVKRSDSKAEKYFKKAAKKNSVEGLIELGKVYQKVNPYGNLELSEKVWTKAASLGSDEARCLIASLYYENAYAVRNRTRQSPGLKSPLKTATLPHSSRSVISITIPSRARNSYAVWTGSKKPPSRITQKRSTLTVCF